VNYLAHLYLTADHPQWMVGGMVADFLRGAGSTALPEGVREGVRRHWAIDRFADEHPVFRTSRRRLEPPFRRWAGVLVDIYYDHFLARDWKKHCPDQSLPDFAQDAYQTLQDHEAALPPRLRRMLPHMAAEDWLTSYREVAGIDRTLRRLSGRVRRENPFSIAVQPLIEHYDDLARDFDVFFPDLVEFVGETASPSPAGHLWTNRFQ
jgi:acyl carrier protein phosphodiesterase